MQPKLVKALSASFTSPPRHFKEPRGVLIGTSHTLLQNRKAILRRIRGASHTENCLSGEQMVREQFHLLCTEKLYCPANEKVCLLLSTLHQTRTGDAMEAVRLAGLPHFSFQAFVSKPHLRSTDSPGHLNPGTFYDVLCNTWCTCLMIL